MALTTADILNAGAVVEAGITIDLYGAYVTGLEFAESTSEKNIKSTHHAYIDPLLDIRDGFDKGTFTEEDSLGVPDAEGTIYLVVYRQVNWLREKHKLYLRRETPTWPTNNL
ncbi:MAG: hypothetical protein ACFCD0_23900 [Gemmataceae bacterium]